MMLFADKLCRETDVVQYLHLIHPSQSIDKLVNELAMSIKDRPINEATFSQKSEDSVLRYMFVLLCTIITKLPSARESFIKKNELIEYLLAECMFVRQDKGHTQKDVAQPPKCKTQNSRDACMLLIKELLIENKDGVKILVEFLSTNIYKSDTCLFWRTQRKQDWHVASLSKQEKSATGFVGLKNIGCICYMNSIMQQLFMIPSFRKAILEVEDKQNEPPSQNVLYQIKRIFGGLTDLEKQYYNPKKFCEAFKDIDGSPIDPTVQKDVDEFFNPLIDKIENLIKGTKEEKVMKNLFYGSLANEVICKDCPHQSEREEPFQNIQLVVKNKKSIQESLEAYIEGDHLEGDNAYYCDKCEKKRDSLRRQSIKRLPNVLFLMLRRFEFNYDTMTKFKVNDYCSFPMELDMSPYC
jgi:ubiquitin carboxyl-terminal hydrolase 9/24